MIFITTHSAEETMNAGEKIGSFLKPGDVVAMEGTLAAGKTTMTKGIARALGVIDQVTSPTFTIISEYDGAIPLYHMDVYRLDSGSAFIDTGAEELMYGKGVCVIEWSEKVKDELPKNTITISITMNADNSRTITVHNWKYGQIAD